jgi:hypothetical protein
MSKDIEPEVPKDSRKGENTPKANKPPSLRPVDSTPKAVKPLSPLVHEETPGASHEEHPKDASPFLNPYAEDSRGCCKCPNR